MGHTQVYLGVGTLVIKEVEFSANTPLTHTKVKNVHQLLKIWMRVYLEKIKIIILLV